MPLLQIQIRRGEKGEIKSRRERDEKVGHIKKKYKVTRYLAAKGKRNEDFDRSFRYGRE